MVAHNFQAILLSAVMALQVTAKTSDPCDERNRSWGYHCVEDLVYPLFVTTQKVEYMRKSFRFRENDVVLISYPKTGTMLHKQLMTLLHYNGSQPNMSMDQFVIWVETQLAFPDEEGISGAGSNMQKMFKLQEFEAMVGRRYLALHGPPSHSPPVNPRAKYIFLTRNPKDTCTSFYWHSKGILGIDYKADFGAFSKDFLHGRVHYGSWFDFYLEWEQSLAFSGAKHVLTLQYEDFLANPEMHIKKLANFLGFDHNAEVLKHVVNGSRIETMRKHPKANLEWVPYHKDAAAGHLRKGKVGDWKDYFSAQMSELFDAKMQKDFEGSSLRFRYELSGSANHEIPVCTTLS